jgi:hypothetical protein
MTDYIEDPYFGSEYDDIFNDLYELEGVRKIKELSRQLRTFFNYRAEVIRYRFQPSSQHAENNTNTKFFNLKKETESLTHEFIAMLKKSKKPHQTLEEGLRFLFFNEEKTFLKELSRISKNLSILLHYFSEENLHDHPKFLKFSVVLAQHLCLVKKCLNAQFSEFFEELEINYNNLEEELVKLIEITPVKKQQSKKQLEERMTS